MLKKKLEIRSLALAEIEKLEMKIKKMKIQ